MGYGVLAEADAQVAAALALPLLAGPGAGPDRRTGGHSPAQDTRWAAAGNRVRFRPVSAMTARARSLTPGISASRATAFSTGVGVGVRAGGPVRVDAPDFGHRSGQPGGPGGQLSDPVIEKGDLVQQHACEQRPLLPRETWSWLEPGPFGSRNRNGPHGPFEEFELYL